MDEKKYLNYTPLYKTKCIDTYDTVFLRPKWYNVIATTPSKLLIQFNSGGVMWYSKKRFAGYYILK